MSLSAIIATKNEQQFLPNCLRSVSFADEIVIIDSGSTDKTLEIAHKHGAKIYKHEWKGFAPAHNFGAQKSRGDWLLYLDADERISSKLSQEIQSVLKNPQADAYQINRLNYIMGQPLHHGGWYPDPATRLIKKSALKLWVGDLHEYPEITGTTSHLSADLYHLTHRSLTWMMYKSISYTQLYAGLLYENHHPPVKVKNFLGAMTREFYYRAIKTSGWRDGFVGWLEIIYQTFNAFLIQVYLWQLQQHQTMDQQYHHLDQELSREL